MGSSREAVGSRSKRASEDASAAPAREARGDDAGAWDVVVVGAGVAVGVVDGEEVGTDDGCATQILR